MTPIHIMESIVGLVIFIPLTVLASVGVYLLLYKQHRQASFCGNCLKETHIENGICTTCNNKKVYHDD